MRNSVVSILKVRLQFDRNGSLPIYWQAMHIKEELYYNFHFQEVYTIVGFSLVEHKPNYFLTLTRLQQLFQILVRTFILYSYLQSCYFDNRRL